jgi:hypothetical protein
MKLATQTCTSRVRMMTTAKDPPLLAVAPNDTRILRSFLPPTNKCLFMDP